MSVPWKTLNGIQDSVTASGSCSSLGTRLSSLTGMLNSMSTSYDVSLSSCMRFAIYIIQKSSFSTTGLCLRGILNFFLINLVSNVMSIRFVHKVADREQADIKFSNVNNKAQVIFMSVRISATNLILQ